MAHGIARVAEHQRGRRVMEAQQVDDGELRFLRVDPDGAVLDVGMAARAARHLDAQRVALVVGRELDDRLGQCRGEEQALALRRRRLQDELEIVAEAEIEHLVGLVEHDGPESRDIETVALDMIAQAAGRADDEMGALVEQGGLAARIHAADAGDDAGIGVLVEPGEFALNLQGQFARRRDDQGERLAGSRKHLGFAQQRARDGEPIGDGLARAGLRGDEQVAARGVLLQHGVLHRRRIGIIAFGQRTRERRAGWKKGHGMSGLGVRALDQENGAGSRARG